VITLIRVFLGGRKTLLRICLGLGQAHCKPLQLSRVLMMSCIDER
jgi:hypothetical protein